MNIGSYSLSPTKAPIKYITSLWPSYILSAFIYSLSLFGIIGLTLIDFVQGYILSEYKFVHTTSTYKVLGNAFFFDVQAGMITDQGYPLKIAVPLIALASSFFLAVVIKQLTKNSKSPYLKQVRRFFAYNLFLSVWSVMFIPIIYQGGQYVLYLAIGYVGLSQNKKIICDIISYFNFLTVPLYFYFMNMVMNPKCG